MTRRLNKIWHPRQYLGQGPRPLLLSRLWPVTRLTLLSGWCLLSLEQAVAQQAPPADADMDGRHRQPTTIIRSPVVWPYPYPTSTQHRVRVIFEAQGSDWGAVYLDDRLIYRAYNHNRQESIQVRPGGYRLEITGVARSDVWASGYLDLGRDHSRLVVIRFSKDHGVQVSGDPYVWIPDQ